MPKLYQNRYCADNIKSWTILTLTIYGKRTGTLFNLPTLVSVLEVHVYLMLISDGRQGQQKCCHCICGNVYRDGGNEGNYLLQRRNHWYLYLDQAIQVTATMMKEMGTNAIILNYGVMVMGYGDDKK